MLVVLFSWLFVPRAMELCKDCFNCSTLRTPFCVSILKYSHLLPPFFFKFFHEFSVRQVLWWKQAGNFSALRFTTVRKRGRTIGWGYTLSPGLLTYMMMSVEFCWFTLMMGFACLSRYHMVCTTTHINSMEQWYGEFSTILKNTKENAFASFET